MKNTTQREEFSAVPSQTSTFWALNPVVLPSEHTAPVYGTQHSRESEAELRQRQVTQTGRNVSSFVISPFLYSKGIQRDQFLDQVRTRLCLDRCAVKATGWHPRCALAEWGNASHADHGNPALTQSRIASCLLSFMFYYPVDTLLA